ncbi:MAG TPA: arsenate reductase (glutaredoxin) [Spongiibacteraceae bacterium]|jgi:arsenate reductase|nr:arsenate reductase (glutaredoxin) [Spongiibacteraceae bacterium]HUH36338.1 arsenate reductase (glutaredoxin) [Spongiibacteraceae bacterium]
MSELTIYHNPRCSKSRETLQLLETAGYTPRVVLYLDTPPSAATLRTLLKKLGMSARQLLRSKEALAKELGLDDPALSEQALITAMVEHPRLIERPIVVRGNQAVLGRPPQNVLALLVE